MYADRSDGYGGRISRTFDLGNKTQSISMLKKLNAKVPENLRSPASKRLSGKGFFRNKDMREKASCHEESTVPFLKDQVGFENFIVFFLKRSISQICAFLLDSIVVPDLVVLSQESVRFFQMIISRSQLLKPFYDFHFLSMAGPDKLFLLSTRPDRAVTMLSAQGHSWAILF